MSFFAPFCKKSLWSVVLAMAIAPIFAQQHKDVRQTYLWDVTLSMKGYKGAPDIYDKVVDAMVNDIKSITNERTEIVVIPFQDTDHCDEWHAKATAEGKADIISKIKSYNNENITNTNISAPIMYSINHVFSNDRIDVLKLMTDGVDNVDKEKLNRTLEQWCDIAKDKDVFGYYIMLTNAAGKDAVVIKEKAVCRFEIIHGTEVDAIISLTPQKSASINLRDESFTKPVKLKFTANDGASRVPSGFKVLIQSEENPYVEIDEVATLSDDYTVSISPRFKMSSNELKDQLPEDRNETVTLKMRPASGMDVSPYSMTRILDLRTSLSLINKSEKTLRFHVQKTH